MIKKIVALAGAAAIALGMSGCGGSQDKSAQTDSKDDKVTVFATTNVWGSVAKHIGGDLINVEEGVTDPAQDPHGYEATAKDKLKVSKADVVIVNGGGYDVWGEKLADSVDPKPTVISAVDLSDAMTDEEKKLAKEHGEEHEAEEHAEDAHDHDADEHKAEGTDEHEADEHADDAHDHDGEDAHDHEEGHEHRHHHHHEGFNEHVFYDLDTVAEVGDALADQLAKDDPDNAKAYQDNAKKFDDQIDTLKDKAHKHAEEVEHVHVVATEPVSGYLLKDMGIHDITPPEYVEQSETDAGPSPKVMTQTLDLINSGEAHGLILNGQTEDSVSDQLVKAAKAKDIPVVKVYESFPAGTDDIVEWLGTAIDDLSQIK